jgi:hypothetical protein
MAWGKHPNTTFGRPFVANHVLVSNCINVPCHQESYRNRQELPTITGKITGTREKRTKAECLHPPFTHSQGQETASSNEEVLHIVPCARLYGVAVWRTETNGELPPSSKHREPVARGSSQEQEKKNSIDDRPSAIDRSQNLLQAERPILTWAASV